MKIARLTLALAALLLAGCSASEPEAVPDPPATLDVELTMDVQVNPDGTVSLSATSNLPDGTELGSMVFQEGGYIGQDSQTLEGGTVEFGPFGDKGGPLSPGTYDVSVTMPIARNQPDAVKAIIGEHGENLTGSLVESEDITGDAVVSVEEALEIQ